MSMPNCVFIDHLPSSHRLFVFDPKVACSRRSYFPMVPRWAFAVVISWGALSFVLTSFSFAQGIPPVDTIRNSSLRDQSSGVEREETAKGFFNLPIKTAGGQQFGRITFVAVIGVSRRTRRQGIIACLMINRFAVLGAISCIAKRF